MSNQSEESARFVTCHCQHCNGAIEFDATDFAKGETRAAECPHCRLETILFVPPQGTANKAVRVRIYVPRLQGKATRAVQVAVVVVLLGGAFWLLNRLYTHHAPITGVFATPLSGQVFIVTQGGINLRLGDVEMDLVEKSQVVEFIQKKLTFIETGTVARKKAL
jgi:hypothetical protein